MQKVRYMEKEYGIWKNVQKNVQKMSKNVQKMSIFKVFVVQTKS